VASATSTRNTVTSSTNRHQSPIREGYIVEALGIPSSRRALSTVTSAAHLLKMPATVRTSGVRPAAYWLGRPV